jgi:hypothetical protein
MAYTNDPYWRRIPKPQPQGRFGGAVSEYWQAEGAPPQARPRPAPMNCPLAVAQGMYRTICLTLSRRRFAAALATVAAISLLVVTVSCSKSGSPGRQVNGPEGKTYAVGDSISWGGNTGTYCATVDSTGTPDYPNIRHFAIANSRDLGDVHSDDTCSSVIRFFQDFIAAKSNAGGMWHGIAVDINSGYSGQLGGYSATWIAGYDSPYGKPKGFAAGF